MLSNDDSITNKSPEPTSDIRPVSAMSVEEIKKEKMRIWKNVTVISLSFMCLFTAYNSVANLQVLNYAGSNIKIPTKLFLKNATNCHELEFYQQHRRPRNLVSSNSVCVSHRFKHVCSNVAY